MSQVGRTWRGGLEIEGTLQWFLSYALQNCNILLPGYIGFAWRFAEAEKDLRRYAFGSLVCL